MIPVSERSGIVRGSSGSLLNRFLKPWLPRAAVYRRAVGFFSSNVFAVAAPEFEEFFRRGGTMELVCSPLFSKRDLAALLAGLYDAREWAGRNFEEVTTAAMSVRATRFLTWTLAHRKLELRVAIIPGNRGQAIYHEKIGVFLTHEGQLIGFEGSANESSNAYVDNFERILLHDSEDANGVNYARAVNDQFDRLWANETSGVEVLSLHEALKRQLIRQRKDEVAMMFEEAHEPSPPPVVPPEMLRRPFRLELRPYQEQAITVWFAHQGVGLFAMATGTGKTITALAAVEQVFQRAGPPLVVVIIAPYLHLVEQWIGVAKTFGLDPINCSGSRSDWTGAVDAALYLVHTGKRPVLSLVVTNSTFAQTAFQAILDQLQVRTVLIADEVHNLGARNLQTCLPQRIRLRLGLSATPERWMDEDGTTAIREYFGEVVCRLTLEDALKLQPPVLTPYTYHPVIVELEDDEREEYLRITRQLARYIDNPRLENLADVALGLLLKRSRLVACARRKLPAFAAVIAPYAQSRYNLVYCGDGRLEVETADARVDAAVSETEVLRQVEAVARLLGTDYGMNVAIYTSDVPAAQRESILREFEQGHKQALVAIRCLDEGIDIPEVRRAFILASSTNPRQFIQRRGRILRRAEGKDVAEIYDFIVAPPLDAITPGTAEFRVLRNLVQREMERVTEFARLARNGPQALVRLLPILSRLRLMHL